jgi:hypothetical protein
MRRSTATRLIRLGSCLWGIGVGIYIGWALREGDSSWQLVIAVALGVMHSGLLLDWAVTRRNPDLGPSPTVISNPRQLQQSLRQKLENGWPLEAAVRELHTTEEADLLVLWPAVVAVTGLGRTEAMKLVVHAVTQEQAAG